MYKMCVIDDMKSVVDSIVQYIDWSHYDIEIGGTATNGVAGMNLIKETRPDIVVTDIRMPLMDGLDMVVQVLEHLPNVKIIIMSGFADFEYAQRAIRLGAIDFISKPVTPNELIQSVTKAKEALEHERRGKQLLQRLQMQEKESLPLLRQDYFNLLVRYFSTEEKAKERLGLLQVSLEMKPFHVMVVEIDHYEKLSKALPLGEVELIHFAVQNILEETIQRFTTGLVFKDYQMKQLICVMNVTDQVTIQALAEHCRDHMKQFSRYTISIGIGLLVEKVDELPLSYQQAMLALSYSFYFEDNTIIAYDKAAEFEIRKMKVQLPSENELLHAVLSGNQEKSTKLLQHVYDANITMSILPRPSSIIEAYYELASSLFKQMNTAINNETDKEAQQTLQQIKNGRFMKYQELHQNMLQFLSSCHEWVELDQARDSQVMINQSIKYIKENLHLSLTINECANLAHLSPSYYANLFKKSTGMTFRNYVTQERIEQAKRLLLTDMQVQEIAFKVGFEDRPYFTELFKKQVGMTPSEFKSIHSRR